MPNIRVGDGHTSPVADYATAQLAWDTLSGSDQGGAVVMLGMGNCGTAFNPTGSPVNLWSLHTEGVIYGGDNQADLATLKSPNIQAVIDIDSMYLSESSQFLAALMFNASSDGSSFTRNRIEQTAWSGVDAVTPAGSTPNSTFSQNVVTGGVNCIDAGFNFVLNTNKNVLLESGGDGFEGSGSNGTQTDCYSGGNATNDYFGVTLATCASSDSTGSVGLQSITIVNALVDAANDDFRSKSGGPLDGTGSVDFIGAFLESGGSGVTVTTNPIDQSQTIDQVTLTEHSVLTIGGLSQAQTVDQITLQQGGVLSLNNLEQIQTIDQVNLTQAHIVTVNDLSQVQTLDQIVLSAVGAGTVAINDLSQAQVLDQLTLAQLNVVSVDNLSQAQLLDSINFNGVVVGFLQGALTIVSAYNGQIKLTNPLTGEIRIL